MIECPVCNSYNPDGVVACMVCTQPLPKSNPTVFHEYGKSKAKLALFNLEDAVLDNAAATRVATRKQTKKGRKFDFELAQNLEKDVLIPGAKNFIDDLVQDGFKVAFVSQKSKEHMFRQKEHLQQLGIPLMSDARGVMLYMSTDSKVIKDLKEMYDIQFFFGESEKTAKRARIPGVYRNIEEYTGVRANPYLAPEEGKGAYTLVNPLPNPPLKPKRKKMKNGKYRKEPAKNYVQRFMDDPKMSAEFPDRSQRYAVAMSYAEEFYGARANPPVSNPPSNKKMKKAKKVYKSFNQKDPVEIKNEMVDVGDVWVSLGKAWCIGYRSGKEGLGDEQKYIHHFGVDEETGKKYEEPELYLSMPEKGKPMLMLKGGGWKVKSADGSISWIYH
tara:strand:- start:1200 stop:2357 length:1158 start_codon:yes stop_codon:yes gene_type:complete